MPYWESTSTAASGSYSPMDAQDVFAWVAFVPMDAPAAQKMPLRTTGADESVGKLFRLLTDQWMAETAFTSSMEEIIESEPYQAIINLGPIVVPLILDDLRNS